MANYTGEETTEKSNNKTQMAISFCTLFFTKGRTRMKHEAPREKQDRATTDDEAGARPPPIRPVLSG